MHKKFFKKLKMFLFDFTFNIFVANFEILNIFYIMKKIEIKGNVTTYKDINLVTVP